jgi:hypothetical protein
MTRSHSVIGSALIWSTLAVSAAGAQTPLKHAPTPVAPCCSVAAVDARTGVVTARVLASGATFQFMFGWFDPKLGYGPVDGLGPVDGAKLRPALGFGPVDAVKGAATLHVGQAIWANQKGRVSVNGVTACCGVVTKLGSGGGMKVGPPQAEIDAHQPGCDAVAASTFPQGGHHCEPLATMTTSGKNPDGSDATYSWTCVCS